MRGLYDELKLFSPSGLLIEGTENSDSNGVSRILIVDDDPRFRRTLQLALDAHGYKVDGAASGKEALDYVSAKEPDLVVMDWQMPDMNGIQTCRTLRAHFSRPVIMISGNRSNSIGVALAAGADDYLAKPFSIDELVTRIESVLQRGKS